MKKFPLIVLCLGFILGSSSQAADNPQLVQAIDMALSASCLDDAATSISILSLPDGEPVYQHNAERALLPASTMKLVTTAAALHYLGAEYRFKTDVLYQGERQGDELRGDLILRGGGDPKLSTADLWTLARHVKNSGIRRVSGNLVIDSGFFDDAQRAPSWTAQKSQKPWDANLGGLSINLNNITVHAQPGLRVGDPLNIWVEPMSSYIVLDAQGSTISPGSKKRKDVWATRTEMKDGRLKVVVRGNLAPNSGEKRLFLNVTNPLRYAAETFRSVLGEVGVDVQGPIIKGGASSRAVFLYQHESQPLFMTLKELNTFSNNFIAEQVLKTIAAESYGEPGTHQHGLQMSQLFLHKLGINTEGLLLADGSGLSRENRFTASAMTDLLQKMLLRFDIGPDFLALLRVLGNPESTSKRLKKSPAKGLVRAKTGTLSGVSTLVGYVPGKNGHLFAYAFFLNNNRCGYHGADQVENKIINALYTLENSATVVPPLSALTQ